MIKAVYFSIQWVMYIVLYNLWLGKFLFSIWVLNTLFNSFTPSVWLNSAVWKTCVFRTQYFLFLIWLVCVTLVQQGPKWIWYFVELSSSAE